MAGNDPKTKIIITAEDEASAVFDGLKTRLTGVAAAVAGAFAADKLIDFVTELAPVADAAASLEAKIRLAVGEMGNLDSAMLAVRQSANDTGTDINAVGGLFAGLTSSTKELGKSQDEVAQLTDTINKSFVVSGTSASAASGAITQLGQAFASGALRGDEFNSVNEAAPRLMQALADGLGVARGELRKMAEEGKLTSDVIFNALQSQADVINNEFGRMPDTVERATQRIKNEWQVLVGEFNKSTGTFDVVADGLSLIAGNMDSLASAAGNAGELIVAALAVKASAALRGYVVEMGLSTAATTAQAVALDGLAIAGRAATTAVITLGRALPGLALAGVVAGVAALVVEFFRAKSAAEAGEEAVRKMLEDTPPNNAAQQIRAVATEAEAARFKLSAMELAFGEMRSKGVEAAAALESIVKAANMTSVDGIAELVVGLDQLRAGAQVTGEQIEEALATRLRKMSAEDLKDFGIQAEIAFNQGAISAANLATVLDSQASVALQKLGVDAEAALSGMSAKFKESAGALGIMVKQFDRLKESGVDAGAALEKSVKGAIKAAANPKELEHLEQVVKDIGKEGKLSGAAVSAALDEIRRKADEATPGIDSVTEAFKELGVTTDKTLNEAANRAHEAFTRIRTSGAASARELQAAFQVYAERAIAANHGVASSALQVEAAQNGLRVTVDESGHAIVQSMVEAAFATKSVGEAASGAAGEFRDMAEAASEAATAAKDAAEDPKALGTGARAGHSGWEDWTAAELDAAARNRRNSPDLIAGAQAEIERRNEERRARQEEEAQRRKQEERDRLGNGGFSRPAPSGMQVDRVVQINIAAAGQRPVAVFAAPDSVDAVIAALEAASGRAS